MPRCGLKPTRAVASIVVLVLTVVGSACSKAPTAPSAPSAATSFLQNPFGSASLSHVQGRIGVGAIGAPGTPANLVASVIGSTVTLTWNAPTTTEAVATYVLEAGSAAGLANLANVATGSTGTSFMATEVGPGTYFVRVRAQNASGVSAASNEVILVVGGPSACALVPQEPGNLVATVSGNSLTMTWSAPAGGCAPSSYRIQAGSSAGLSNIAVVDTGSPATSFSASGIGAGTYFIRIHGSNAYGFGSASNEVTVTIGSTSPAPCALGAPAGLVATVSRDQGSVTFSWQPVPGAQGYFLEAGTTSGSASLGNIDVGPGTTFLTGAPPGVYYARVRARSGTNCVSPPSADASFIVSPPDVLWNVRFGTPPGMSLGACQSGLYWATQRISVDGTTGAFHDVWSPDQPNTARIDGTLTTTTFSATLTCISNPTSGTLSGTWDGSAFVGTVNFAGQNLPLRVVPGALGGLTAAFR